MADKITLKVFATPDLMSEAAGEFIVRIAAESIAARGKFTIALSGGNTPGKLFSLLASASFRERIDWKKIFVFWGDERCVPMDSERNNAHMAKTLLLDKIKIPTANIYPIPVNLGPAEAAKKYEETLKVFFGEELPSFDLILLGLGDNGHTASLFPYTSVLIETHHWIREVHVEEQKEWRITMTVPLINQAAHIAFLVSGIEKAKVLQTILNGPYDPDQYPAQLIKPAEGHLFWFADQAAATDLKTCE
jgi:6-phosphogluconolactonase